MMRSPAHALAGPAFERQVQTLDVEYREANPERKALLRWFLHLNPHALRFVWDCDQVKGGEKCTLMAIAFLLRYGHTKTEALRLAALTKHSGNSDDTTWNHLRTYEELRLVRVHRAGGYRYVFELLLPQLSLPLHDAEPTAEKFGTSRSAGAQSTENTAEKFGTSSGKATEKFGTSSGKATEKFGSLTCGVQRIARARGSRSRSLYLDHDHDLENPRRAEALRQFLTWHNAAYGDFNRVGGMPVKKILTEASPEARAVQRLLVHYTPDELTSMVVELWTVKASPDDHTATFIASTDRSLRIISDNIAAYLHKRSLLRRHAAAPQPSTGRQRTEALLQEAHEWDKEHANGRTGP